MNSLAVWTFSWSQLHIKKHYIFFPLCVQCTSEVNPEDITIEVYCLDAWVKYATCHWVNIWPLTTWSFLLEMGLSKQVGWHQAIPPEESLQIQIHFSPNLGESCTTKPKRQCLGKGGVSTQIWKTVICFSYANHTGSLHTLKVMYVIVETCSSCFC